MSISVPIPKEITEYEEKIMFGLSLRKLICFSSAILLGVGTFFLCTKVFGLSMDIASYIVIVEAMPLMAFGFIKKDGMPFEKYAALMIRHKIGQSKLAYESEFAIDLSNFTNESIEGESKYAWIFEKGNDKSGKTKRSRKERKAEAAIKETIILAPTKKSRKGKRKETCRKIKEARKECREAEYRAKKAVKEGSGSEEHSTAN